MLTKPTICAFPPRSKRHTIYTSPPRPPIMSRPPETGSPVAHRGSHLRPHAEFDGARRLRCPNEWAGRRTIRLLRKGLTGPELRPFFGNAPEVGLEPDSSVRDTVTYCVNLTTPQEGIMEPHEEVDPEEAPRAPPRLPAMATTPPRLSLRPMLARQPARPAVPAKRPLAPSALRFRGGAFCATRQLGHSRRQIGSPRQRPDFAGAARASGERSLRVAAACANTDVTQLNIVGGSAITQLDANGDGSVDAEEFASWHPAIQSLATAIAQFPAQIPKYARRIPGYTAISPRPPSVHRRASTAPQNFQIRRSLIRLSSSFKMRHFGQV